MTSSRWARSSGKPLSARVGVVGVQSRLPTLLKVVQRRPIGVLVVGVPRHCRPVGLRPTHGRRSNRVPDPPAVPSDVQEPDVLGVTPDEVSAASTSSPMRHD